MVATNLTNISQVNDSSDSVVTLSAQQDQLLRHDNAWLAVTCVIDALTSTAALKLLVFGA